MSRASGLNPSMLQPNFLSSKLMKKISATPSNFTRELLNVSALVACFVYVLQFGNCICSPDIVDCPGSDRGSMHRFAIERVQCAHLTFVCCCRAWRMCNILCNATKQTLIVISHILIKSGQRARATSNAGDMANRQSRRRRLFINFGHAAPQLEAPSGHRWRRVCVCLGCLRTLLLPMPNVFM